MTDINIIHPASAASASLLVPLTSGGLTILGGLVGAALAHLSGRYAQRRLDRRNILLLKLTKGEEVVASLEKFKFDNSINIAKWKLVSTIEQFEKIDPTSSPFESNSYASWKAKSILWFPSTKELFADYEKSRSEIGDQIRSLDEGATEQVVFEAIRSAMSEMQGAAEAFTDTAEANIVAEMKALTVDKL